MARIMKLGIADFEAESRDLFPKYVRWYENILKARIQKAFDSVPNDIVFDDVRLSQITTYHRRKREPDLGSGKPLFEICILDHKRLQKQVLKKAVDSLENDDIEIRNMTWMSMAFHPRKIPQAKKMIQNFSRELCAYLESDKRTQVFQFGVCLYPISKNQEEK